MELDGARRGVVAHDPLVAERPVLPDHATLVPPVVLAEPTGAVGVDRLHASDPADPRLLRAFAAVDVVRDLIGVKAVHTIGYCVAGTTLAATLAYLAAEKRADKVASVTFLTAQVDFEDPGDLKMFVGDDVMAMLKQLTAESGVLDGRVMAATFNLLRGRDLIWNYVVNNYLLGQEPAPFDLLHWNSDVTNLPGEWHRDYLDRL